MEQKLIRWLFAAVGGMILAGCVVHQGPGLQEPTQAPPLFPPWVTSPKMADSVFVYVTGTASSYPTAPAARQAAYDDALRQLSQMIVTEAGGGGQLMNSAGILPLEGVEVLPDCVFIQPAMSGFNAWIQASFPQTEKRRWLERLRAPPRL